MENQNIVIQTTFFGQNCSHSYRVVNIRSLDCVLPSLIAMLHGREVCGAEEVAGGGTPAQVTLHYLVIYIAMIDDSKWI